MGITETWHWYPKQTSGTTRKTSVHLPGVMLDGTGHESPGEILLDDEPHQVKDGQHAKRRRKFQEVDLHGVAHWEDADHGRGNHGEGPGHVPKVAESGAVETLERPVPLVADDDEEGDGGAEAIDADANGGQDPSDSSRRPLHRLLDG